VRERKREREIGALHALLCCTLGLIGFGGRKEGGKKKKKKKKKKKRTSDWDSEGGSFEMN
jgi:hypothetical protein